VSGCKKNQVIILILKFTVLYCLFKLPKVPADCNEEFAGDDDQHMITPFKACLVRVQNIWHICEIICIL